MIFLSSPAKRLDFSPDWDSSLINQPVFTTHANTISKLLKKKTVDELSKILQISSKLAELNFIRYQDWNSNNKDQLKPAILAYQGDVYKSLNISTLDEDEQKYLQDNFRIVSGMYGLLKPFDLIQAYRLEMKIKLGFKNLDNLYDFWSEKINNELNIQIKNSDHKYCVNLASQEYSKIINRQLLGIPFINIKFTQLKDGEVKSFGIYNKKARGLMVRYAAQTNAKTIKDLEKFNLDGYKLIERSDKELIFLKKWVNLN